MFVLLKIKKCIFKTISILILANKKVFWKNEIFLSLFFTQKLATIISNILRVEASIF